MVQNDVLNAVLELEQSQIAVSEFRKEIIPVSRRVRDAAYKRFHGRPDKSSSSSPPSKISTTRCGRIKTRWSVIGRRFST